MKNRPAFKRSAALCALFAVVAVGQTARPGAQSGPVVAPPSRAAAYEITDLGPGWLPSAVNDSGEIVGRTDDVASRPILWQNGKVTELGGLGSTLSGDALGINNAGQVVGWFRSRFGRHLAFVWQNGTVRELPTLVAGVGSEARSINASGRIVGLSGNAAKTGFPYRAVLWDEGRIRDLGTLGGDGDWSVGGTGAADINDAGQVVGTSQTPGNAETHAFLWQTEAMTDLHTLGGTVSQAYSINESGQVVGSSYITDNAAWHGFIWQDGAMRDLGTLGGGVYSSARSINDSGQVVGGAYTALFSARAFVWQNGVMKDLNDLIVPNSGWVLQGGTAINNAGQIVGYGVRNGEFRGVLLTPRSRRPVLVLPGIAGTYAADVSDLGPWMFTRGIHPSGLQIDPLAHAYDDLIQTLKNVGYVEGKDLFIVKYDWRVPVGPSDGLFDGTVNGITAASITDEQFDYGVDYLGYYIGQAMTWWAVDNPGVPLEKVDMIAHSTGGLVARTYIQSAAYGAALDAETRLPEVDKLIMIGVPNRGASKPWNTMQDNWGVDPAFQFVLAKMLNMGFQKVLAGAIITGPDVDISIESLGAPACLSGRKLCFIRQFNPTARALLATYDFIDFGNGFTNVNSNPALRNDLVLDLNAGFDFVPNGDPNAFAEKVAVTAIYGTSVTTPTSVVERVGVEGGEGAIVAFTDFVPRNARPGEVWYDDIAASVSGDGTVPIDSSAGQFFGDSRVTLKAFAEGGNTLSDVSHLGLMYNVDVQKEVLRILGASFVDEDISTDRHEAFASEMSTVLNVLPNVIAGSILATIVDPVDGFVVDGEGRRLGFSAATGPLTEIPGSVWFGNRDGMGWVFEPVVEPLSLQLSGLGSNYYAMVSGLNPTGSSGVIAEGVLGDGETRHLTMSTSANTPPTIAGHGDESAEATGAGGAVVSYKSPATEDAEDGPGIATCSPASGSMFGIGVTKVTCRAVDSGGSEAAETSFDVVVHDTTPPVVTCSNSAPVLSPPNHKMASIAVAIDVTDSVSGSPRFTLVSVTSNEPDHGLGDGDTANDIQGFTPGTADTHGLLRAERSGRGTGRVYSLRYQSTDLAGNVGACTTVVAVPHDSRNKK